MGASLVVLGVVLFLLSSAYGLAGPFYYGHYGYHGGSYATWARGTLRFHTIYPVNQPGFAPPDPATYYVHHPVFTHQLITFTFALFGAHEWSVRLGAMIPTLVSLLLLAGIAWRYLGPLSGGAAAVIFALVPVNIWYGAHIDQGFPSIACLLAFFWFYLRWLGSGQWRVGAAALAFETLAGNFEWSPYFAGFWIFVHAVITAFRKGGRFRAFAALQPLTMILPLAFHYYLVRRAGLLDDMLAAYRNRTQVIAYHAFVSRMAEYAQTLFGYILLVAMVGWLGLVIFRMVTGRWRSVDLVGLIFAFTLIVYMHVFKLAVVTHAYRQLYGNVWAAMACAGLVAVARAGALRVIAFRPAWPRLIPFASPLVVLAVLAGLPVKTSWAGLMESRLHGGIPGWTTFNPDLRQTAFARELEQRTDTSTELYFHFNFQNPPPHRMEWAFYYDRTQHSRTALRSVAGVSPAEREHAVAIVFPFDLRGDELKAFGELADKHPVWMVEDLAAIDLRTEGARVEAYRLAPVVLASSAAGRWLAGPYPFPHMVPNEDLRKRLLAQINAGRNLALPVQVAPPMRPLPIAPAPGKTAIGLRSQDAAKPKSIRPTKVVRSRHAP